MRFGSCPEFISDCYDHSNTFEHQNELESKLALLELNEMRDSSNTRKSISQRGSNASTDNTNYSTSGNYKDEMIFLDNNFDDNLTYMDQFSQQEIIRADSNNFVDESKPFIGAGHYSGFSGDIIADEEEEEDFNNDAGERNTMHEHLMDQMANTLNTLNISNNDIYTQILGIGSDLNDLKFLLQTWCLEGPFPPDMIINTPRGSLISINSTAQCTLVEWNQIANKMKVELMIDPGRQKLVQNSPMKRYYGDLYPNNGRDNTTCIQRGHLFA